MATRDLTVRLRADVEGYRRAMAQAAKATGDLERQGLAVQRAGLAMSSFGAELTRSVTLPILAVGTAATAMAMDFDQTFAQMRGLAGVSADEIDRLKESVLGLAGETGRAPQELAEALYFIRSSGIEGERALDALEVSAKAAASGLGSTEVVADAVTSAMNAYAESGMTAAQATDVLVATAREGKAEPAELAAQMGRLLPVASQLGISFEDVGAAIATLSLNGNDAATSATQLSNVMSKLLKPSQQGAEALEAVGLSTEKIQEMLTEKGLLGTLEELRARLGESGFVKFLEDQQAVQGGLAILGGDLNATRERFDTLAESAGASADAFEQTDSDARKMQQAWAQIQTALIEVGSVIAPLAADVAGFVAAMADGFSKLPDPVQNAIVAIAGLAAAIGPTAWVAGRLVTTVGQLLPMLGNLAVPTNAVSGAFSGAAVSTVRFAGALGTLGKAGAVVGVLLALRGVVGTINDEIDRTSIGKLENELLDLAETGEFAGDTLGRLLDNNLRDMGGGGVAIEQMTEDLTALDKALASLATRDADAAATAFDRISDALQDQGISAQTVEERFSLYADAVASADTANRTTDEAIASATGAIDEQMGALEGAAAAAQSYSDILRAAVDPLFAVTSANASLAEANAAVNAAIEEFGAESPEAVAAHLAAAEAAARQQGALGDLKQAVDDGTVSVDDAVAKLNDWVAQGAITQESANVTALAFYGARDAANSIPGSVSSTVSAPGATAASAEVANLKARLDALPSERTVTVNQVWNTIGSAFGFGGRRAAGGPVSSGKLYEVNEGGKAELLEMGGRTYLMPGMDGHVTPASAAGGMGGGGVTYIDQRQATIHTGANPDQVLDALRKWNRNNGPLPVKVA